MIVERRRKDPMLQELAAAPADNGLSDEEEDAEAFEVLAAYRCGEAVGSEELGSELELD